MARQRQTVRVRQDQPFKGRQFTDEVILWAVRWYLMFPISYRDLELMLLDRGVEVDHTTIFRWIQAYAAVAASAVSLRWSPRSNSLPRRRSCRASTALAARGSPRPAIASCFQASSSAGYSPCSRHHALRVASSIAAVAITPCSRAAAVQRWLPPPGPLAKASARQRSNVATLTPTSHETISTDDLSGGSSRATILSLYAC